MRSLHLSFFSAFLGVLFVERTAASCYYPDGSFPTDYIYTPCTGDQYSTCCIASEGDQCLSNGLCAYPGGSYIFRGACTDKTWDSPACFQHCKSGDSASSYESLVECGGTKYCCSSDGSTCCNDDSKVFDVGTASVIKDFASSTSSNGLIVSATDSSYTQTDVGVAAATTTSYTSIQFGSSSRSYRSTATGTAAAAASASATSTSKPEPAKTSHVAMYAAIAAGVVILLVAIFVVWFFLRRHYKKKTAAMTANNIALPLTSKGFERLPDKGPIPVEAPVPHTSPAPPYQPPAYRPQYHQPTFHGAMELESPYNPPRNNNYGKPVYEAP